MRTGWPAALFALLIPSLPLLAGTVTLEQLRADQSALDAAARDYRQRADGLPRAEREDYRAYIERLRRRLANDCSLLQQADIPLPTDIACPDVMYRIAPAAIDQDSEQTRAEAAAKLDAELGAGLGEFDQRLLREQERVKAKASKSTAGAAAGGQGAAAASEDADASAATGGSASPVDTGGGGSPAEQPPGAGGGSRGEASARPPPPADIPDGRDDDVVARQLREAAEKESDPELRKKLWDEYRRYKQGVH
jgi:hypothetical protein